MFISGITGFGFGMDAMVMQSSEDADKVIKTFEEYIRQGQDPNTVEQLVYQQTGVDPSTILYYDRDRIRRKVEEAYAAHYNQRG